MAIQNPLVTVVIDPDDDRLRSYVLHASDGSVTSAIGRPALSRDLESIQGVETTSIPDHHVVNVWRRPAACWGTLDREVLVRLFAHHQQTFDLSRVKTVHGELEDLLLIGEVAVA